MSRILVGAVAVLALGGTSAARAADIPVKAPPVEVFSWAGFYAGLNAGGFWGDGEQHLVIDDSTGRYFTFGAGQNANVAAVMGVGNQRLSNSGFTGGGQIGYNFHKPGSFGLLGFEADVQWLDPSTTSRRQSFLPPPAVTGTGDPVPFVITDSTSGDWLATFRVRVGVVPANNWLIYGTVGAALAHVKFASSYADGTTAPPQISASLRSNISTSQDEWGVAAGGGVEWALGRNWSVRAEYLHVDVRGRTVSTLAVPTVGVIPAPGTCPPAGAGFCSIFHYKPSFVENIARVGVNYRFDWAGPVVANY